MTISRRFPVLFSVMIVIAAIVAGCKSSDNPTAVTKQGNFAGYPATVAMGNVTVGQSRDTMFTFTNSGTDSAVITGITGTGGPIFTVTVRSGGVAASLPLTVATGASVTVMIHFVPQDVTNYSATSTIALSNCASANISMNITGGGAPVQIAVQNTYTYAQDTYDASNTLVNSINITQRIASLSATFAGKMPLVDAATVGDTTHDYYNLETNGDISWYYTPGATVGDLAAGWYTLPYGTRNTTATQVGSGDGTVTIPSMGTVPVHYVCTVQFVNDTVVNMGARGLRASHARLMVVYSSSIGSVTFTAELYYSPTVAYFALRQYSLVSPALLQSFIPSQRRHQSLTSCVLH